MTNIWMPTKVALADPETKSSTDVVVVGSGVAGMASALRASQLGLSVQIITKTPLGEGASRWAQGGIAAAIGSDDSPEAHAADTIQAGGGLCDSGVVDALTSAAPDAVRSLSKLGVKFDHHGGSLALGREGGHRAFRIVHAGGDATGAEIVRALVERIKSSSVNVREMSVAVDLLLSSDGEVTGVLIADIGLDGSITSVTEISTSCVILATGGLGQAFEVTTNPPSATGDGLAMAARAGAHLRDVEFVQFHPTVLWAPGAVGQRPLLTEALLGQGATIVDSHGTPIMTSLHPMGDLAPRDVVSAAIARHMEKSGEEHLWLDMRPLGANKLESQFPTVLAACRSAGIEPTEHPVPIRPAAHYSCGGIASDLHGKTSIPGLLAVGEVAATRVHGANRLASNSLLEAWVAGSRAGFSAARLITMAETQSTIDLGETDLHESSRFPARGHGYAVSADTRTRTAAETTLHAGIVRDEKGLRSLLEHARSLPVDKSALTDLATLEATNLHAVSTLLGFAALLRQESRGCHQRSDAPHADPDWARPITLAVQQDGAVRTIDAPEVSTWLASA